MFRKLIEIKKEISDFFVDASEWWEGELGPTEKSRSQEKKKEMLTFVDKAKQTGWAEMVGLVEGVVGLMMLVWLLVGGWVWLRKRGEEFSDHHWSRFSGRLAGKGFVWQRSKRPVSRENVFFSLQLFLPLRPRRMNSWTSLLPVQTPTWFLQSQHNSLNRFFWLMRPYIWSQCNIISNMHIGIR